MPYPEPFYNSSFGLGLEGFLNYSNELVGQWFGVCFLFMIFVVSVYTINKSAEVKPSGAVAFGLFICFITSIILKLFMIISEGVIFLIVIALAASLLWNIIGSSIRR